MAKKQCKKCQGELFRLEKKGPHLVASCGQCGSFFQNIPQYDEAGENWSMPFGKYEGKSIEEMPDEYIEWGAQTFRDLNLKSKFEHERKRRYKTCEGSIPKQNFLKM